MLRFLFITLFLFNFTLLQAQNKYVLVVHGGAGTIVKGMMTQAEEDSIRAKLKEALAAGSNVLKSNGSSLDAVTAAINVMEDSPLFNAGKGAVFNSKGQNEMDAAIMDGKTLMAGAVAGVHHIKNPINLARLVMEKSPHVIMTGDGAEEFARSQGMTMMPESYFYYEKRYEQLQKIKEKERQDSIQGHKMGIHEKVVNDYKFGTVGCVALDRSGNLAAGTSTGGMTNKKYGRVGDSPIIGAGTYANNKTCAVSATGYGEYFIRNVVSYDISALMEYKEMSLQDAADFVINKKLKDLGGDGGVIALDRQGNIAMPFNTEGMYRGYIKEDGTIEIEIYK
ncbi:MAG: isoaspartyl peptidase/L-asparaginase [Ignavibacteria bacterium]|jgi:beta-aspartyl-peptidase (threonine type)|nr:isoaspartyl peptidase/L-asparaginase [Ignavibacteria bacterium]MCU7514177.1 isoaspartyl peptidase/L-asparaginase [Ignavibacteria bacterium]MCU7522030.1 isoaspartyl peptidase/L-asparaginase [Ignavibacteria bacterium]MCU7525320.1 isoaspartyl peptidase/L-asparaginase [Ignavibacteria bacterium]